MQSKIYLFDYLLRRMENNRQSDLHSTCDLFFCHHHHHRSRVHHSKNVRFSHFNKYSKSLNKYRILFICNIIYVLFERENPFNGHITGRICLFIRTKIGNPSKDKINRNSNGIANKTVDIDWDTDKKSTMKIWTHLSNVLCCAVCVCIWVTFNKMPLVR